MLLGGGAAMKAGASPSTRSRDHSPASITHNGHDPAAVANLLLNVFTVPLKPRLTERPGSSVRGPICREAMRVPANAPC